MTPFFCPRPGDTADLGARLAALLRPGDVVVLSGPLGAGKTLFTSGIAAGLGVEEPVISPSFILTREYSSGFLPLIHADIYRLTTRNEFDDLDLLSQSSQGVLVIEWGDAVEPILPPDHLRVDFEVADDEARNITLVPFGSWRTRVTELTA
jgi:tRNA threonylcarbamoyladenosine biosynthesis protein TsaE